MIPIQNQNVNPSTDLHGLNLSEEETSAYDAAYFSMLCELGSAEEIQEFLSRLRSGDLRVAFSDANVASRSGSCDAYCELQRSDTCQ